MSSFNHQANHSIWLYNRDVADHELAREPGSRQEAQTSESGKLCCWTAGQALSHHTLIER